MSAVYSISYSHLEKPLTRMYQGATVDEAVQEKGKSKIGGLRGIGLLVRAAVKLPMQEYERLEDEGYT